MERDVGGRGGVYSCVTYLRHLTIGHAFRWKRGTVPTPTRLIETPSAFGRSLCFLNKLQKKDEAGGGGVFMEIVFDGSSKTMGRYY